MGFICSWFLIHPCICMNYIRVDDGGMQLAVVKCSITYYNNNNNDDDVFEDRLLTTTQKNDYWQSIVINLVAEASSVSFSELPTDLCNESMSAKIYIGVPFSGLIFTWQSHGRTVRVFLAWLYNPSDTSIGFGHSARVNKPHTVRRIVREIKYV